MISGVRLPTLSVCLSVCPVCMSEMLLFCSPQNPSNNQTDQETRAGDYIVIILKRRVRAARSNPIAFDTFSQVTSLILP